MAKSVAYRKRSVDFGGMLHPETTTNEEIITLHVNALRALKRSPKTVRDRVRILTVLAEFLHPTTLMTASYEQLLDWQAGISNLSTSTVYTYTTHVRVFYAWLVKPMKILVASPADDLIKPAVPRRKPRPVPEPDFQHALAGSTDDLMRTWLLLARYAGLRCVEIARLNRDDVLDDPPPRLHVHGKGAHERIVFISDELLDTLRPWMRRQGHLFTDDHGHAFKPDIVSQRIARHFDSLGLPYTGHQLRHLYGTDALRRTRNLRLVQSQMGHSSPAITQVYTEVDEPEAIALAAALGRDLRQVARR